MAWAVPAEPGGSLYVKPSPAKIKVTNMTAYGTTPLEILQWVDTGPIEPIDDDDPICANPAPDWFETKVRDIFANATNDVATVFSVVQDYRYQLGERSAHGWVEQRRQEFHTIYLNPYTLLDRIDKTPLSNNIYRCLGRSYVTDRELRRTITHEARHAYQNNLVSRPGNDDDQDWLPEVVDVAPLNIIVDDATPRDRCNSGNVTLSGDDTFDCYFAADPHTIPCDESVWVYQNLIEDDAEQFAEDHKDDDR